MSILKKLFGQTLLLMIPFFSIAQGLQFNPNFDFADDPVGLNMQASVAHIIEEQYTEALKLLSPIILSKDSNYLKPALYLRGYSYYRINRVNLACADWKYYLLETTEENDLSSFCRHYSDSIQEIKNKYYPPEFLGGKDSLDRLMTSISYPINEMMNDVQGKGLLKVHINKEGLVSLVEKIEGNDALAAPLIKAFYLLSNFSPGRLNGEKIDTSFTYSFIFLIDKDDEINPLIDEFGEQDACFLIYKKKLLDIQNDFPNRMLEASGFYDIGVRELKKQKYDLALLNFTKCLNLVHKDKDALYNRGITYYYLNNLEAACKDWQKAAIYGDEQANELFLQKCK